MALLSSIFVLAGGIVSSSGRFQPSKDLSPHSALSSYRLGQELQLSPSGNGERYQPAVAYNHRQHEYLAVWHNTWPDGRRDIYARRVSDSGQVLTWFAVATGLGPGGDGKSRLQPTVAYNAANDEYLVVWMLEASANVYEIWGRLVAWNGGSMGPEFQIIQWANRSFWTPRVAWNSYRNEYMVIWNAFDTSGGLPGVANDVAGYRVSASGVVQYPGSPIIITDSDSPHQADLVYNVAMDEYFIVWVRVYSAVPPGTGNDIYGARLTWAGSVVTPPGAIAIYSLEKDQNAPAVATNEQDRYMVVWEHAYTGTDRDIYGREYNADGSPVGSYFTIASWTEDTTAPDIAANGSSKEWLAVWQQALGGGTGYAIKGFRWGSTVNTYYFDVANYAFWENESPAVAADIPGYLVVYEGDSSTTNRHIFGRMWWPEAVYLPLALHNAP